MELSGYLAIVRRWWWTLIVAAWIAGLTGWLVASAIPPTYESQVKVLVGPLNTDTETLRGSGQLVQTYAQYVTTREVLASAIQEVGLDLTPDDLAAATRATANDVTRILTIRVQAGNPEQASNLANTLATELEQLTSGGLSRPEGLIQIIEFARPETTPVAPQVSLLVLLAALAGVVVAVVLVLLLEYFGNTVRTGQELAALARAPLLGTVGAPGGDPPRPRDLVVQTAPNSRAAAPYRLVSAKIALGPERRHLRSILVVDADWEGEAAVVASNLAAALGGFGRRVVLVDGAGAGGTVTRLQGWQDRPGLSELLDGARSPVPPEDGGRLAILPAGRAALEGADPDRLRQIVEELVGSDGIVVFAGAPIQSSPMTLALARAADAVILVARRDRSRREDIVFAGESLRLVEATLAGVVLTERGSVRRLGRGEAGAARPVAPIEIGPAGVRPANGGGARSERRSRPRGASVTAAQPSRLATDTIDHVPAP